MAYSLGFSSKKDENQGVYKLLKIRCKLLFKWKIIRTFAA